MMSTGHFVYKPAPWSRTQGQELNLETLLDTDYTLEQIYIRMDERKFNSLVGSHSQLSVTLFHCQSRSVVMLNQPGSSGSQLLATHKLDEVPALFVWLGQQGIGLRPGGLVGWILIKPINAEQQIMPSFYSILSRSRLI